MAIMLLLKGTLLWSGLLVAARLLRSAHPADRHRVWTIGFAALLLLPILAPVLPSLDVPVSSSWVVPSGLEKTATTPSRTLAAGAAGAFPNVATPPISRNVTEAALPAPNVTRDVEWTPVRSIAVGVWMVGALTAALLLLVSLIRVQRLTLTAVDLDDPAWQEALRATAGRLGVRRPIRLVAHERVRVPMAGGLWHPVIYLPRAADEWTADRRLVVLAHEIAHLAGRDPLRLIVARLAVALYWFHPLAWIAARQSGVDLEEACDAAVLDMGTRPSVYATLLLEFAESIQSRTPLAALPIVQRSLLERRLMAILRDQRVTAARMRLFLPAVCSLIAAVSIAAAQPIARTVALSSPPAPTLRTSATSLTSAAAPDRTARIVEPDRHHAVAPVPVSEADCWSDPGFGSSFSGTISTSGADVTMQVGTSDGARIIKETLDDARVCMIATGVSDLSRSERPSAWLAHADRIVMESQRNGRVIRLTLNGAGGGAQQPAWTVNGAQRTFDAAAAEWRDRLLGVLDNIWDLSTVRGQVSTLRGHISTIYGQESTLRGQISTLRGQVSTMRGEESTIRGRDSSLHGEISSIRGHVSSLRGELSSEQGAISSLDSGGSSERPQSDMARHRDEIARIERELREYDEAGKVAEVEQRIKQLDVEGKVADIETRIRAFDLDAKVAAIDQQIKDLDVDGKVAAIQRQIEALDADRRGGQLEDQRDAAVRQLEAAIDRIK
jgi:beta-lactamase regulating signal transducer with metallopeptidase domain